MCCGVVGCCRFLARARLPRKALDLLRQVDRLHGGERPVGPELVVERFCNHHHMPRHLIDPQVALDLAQVEDFFRPASSDSRRRWRPWGTW